MPRKIKPIDRDDVLGAIGEAYRAGYEAQRNGFAFRSDNPYKRGTQCRQMWHLGWERAEHDAAQAKETGL